MIKTTIAGTVAGLFAMATVGLTTNPEDSHTVIPAGERVMLAQFARVNGYFADDDAKKARCIYWNTYMQQCPLEKDESTESSTSFNSPTFLGRPQPFQSDRNVSRNIIITSPNTTTNISDVKHGRDSISISISIGNMRHGSNGDMRHGGGTGPRR